MIELMKMMDFGIKRFEECVTDDELREFWIEIAEGTNLRLALRYMKGEELNFEITDNMWGSPVFWRMVAELNAIAKHFDYSVEAGFVPPLKVFDLEILSPEARQALREESLLDLPIVQH